jgi:ABC-type multidrug transport system fused ATPase/permease subunit
MSRHRSFGEVDPTFTAKARSAWEIIQRVSRYLLPYKAMAAGTMACAILSLAFSFAFPKLTQFIIDEVIANRRWDLLGPVLAALPAHTNQ